MGSSMTAGAPPVCLRSGEPVDPLSDTYLSTKPKDGWLNSSVFLYVKIAY